MKTIYCLFILSAVAFSLDAQKVSIKDVEDNVLMEVNDEGTTGSITLLSGVVPVDVQNKLYNVGNRLYWRGTELGTILNGGGWINEGSSVYLANLADRVGVGTASPASKLNLVEGGMEVHLGHIASTITEHAVYARRDYLTEGLLARKSIQSEENPLKFYYGVQGVAYDPTGEQNIGVYGSAAYGNTNWAGFFEGGAGGEPIVKFESFPVGSHGAIRIENAAGNHLNIGIVEDPANAFAINYNENIGALTDLVRINPDGKIGFGTSAPLANLHINDNTSSGVTVMIHNQDDEGSERLYFGTSTGADAGISVWGSSHPSQQGKFRFFNNKTNANYDWVTSGIVRMTLANDGDFGLGVTTPSARIHVVQAGAGDALRVDDAPGDTSSFVVKASGDIGIGTLNPETKMHAKKGDKQMFFDLDYVNTDSYETSVLGIIGTNVGASGDLGCRKTTGVDGETYYGVRGISSEIGSDVNIGVYGAAGFGSINWAGFFVGDVKMGNDLTVLGIVSKGAGSFKIDHPLDPTNKYLSHSFVESPDMMNIYNGNVILDDRGEAVVAMPDWFEPLNRDFRYQLTPIGGPGPNLHIAQRMTGNQFRIAGGSPGLEVSWQVTGIRQDPFANKNRIQVEEFKSPADRGRYLHPEAFDKPIELIEGYGSMKY